MKILYLTRNEKKISGIIKLTLLISVGFIFLANWSAIRGVLRIRMMPKFYPTQNYTDKYCVFYNFWQASEPFLSGDYITLVLHSTPEYISYLEEQVQTWNGTISIAIFVPTPYRTNFSSIPSIPDQNFAIPSLYFSYFISILSTFDHLKNTGRVSMHLFFENQDFGACPIVAVKSLDEDFPISDLKSFEPINQLYPINVARNIARLGSKTSLFLSSDIENIFVENYEPRMKKLANDLLIRKNRRAVLIHRRFEIEENLPIPKNKTELYELYKVRKAVEFHALFYGQAHRIPFLDTWFKQENINGTVEVFMDQFYENSEWEPQFVSTNDIPYHDESFAFRLRSNTHLANELCRANYTFSIATELFSVHRGIKKRLTSNEMQAYNLAIRNSYRKVFWNFFRRLDKQYPETKHLCPIFK